MNIWQSWTDNLEQIALRNFNYASSANQCQHMLTKTCCHLTWNSLHLKFSTNSYQKLFKIIWNALKNSRPGIWKKIIDHMKSLVKMACSGIRGNYFHRLKWINFMEFSVIFRKKIIRKIFRWKVFRSGELRHKPMHKPLWAFIRNEYQMIFFFQF